jgi:hypothetical protein
MRRRVNAASLGLGAAFGFLISWGQFSDPDRIRDMLLLRDPYLYLMMFSAMGIGLLGLRVLRRRQVRALLTRSPVKLERARPERRHIAGAAVFGLGWSLSDSCPAPVAAQLAHGVWWSLFTIAGIFLGIELYFLRREPERTRARPVRASRTGRRRATTPAP